MLVVYENLTKFVTLDVEKYILQSDIKGGSICPPHNIDHTALFK
jgi:hypothetical protein